uniref:serine hydrolase domain-containing protein n=1 Tax=Nocardiopsis gilva TaxID=280236 RepID=UPI000475AB96|nr:serine hydrolase domain-containing protein [Nocardiopsis gilva]
MSAVQNVPHDHAAPADPPPSGPPLPARAPRRAWAVAGVIGIVVAVLAFAVMPNKGHGPIELEGDPELAKSVAASIKGVEDRAQGLSVVRIDGAERQAVEGGTADGRTTVTPDTPFETGSVFKVVTAMTLADLVENGETRLDRTLGDIFPDVDFASADVAEITLEELATHRSGLARVPMETMGTASITAGTLRDPYTAIPPVADSLAVAQLETPGEWAYSNFGFAVLGEALARESGTPYPELVHERVLDPLGMDDTFILGADTDDIPEGAAVPHAESGARTEPWNAVHYAPAGVGTWSTTADLERLVRAMMDGTAPGASAAEPPHEGPVDETRLGLAWITTDFGDGVELTQHSGATYGSTAFIGYQGDRAVIAISNSFAVDAAAIGPRAMGAPEVPPVAEGELAAPTWLLLVQTLLMVALPPLLAVALMARRRTLVGQRHLDRLRIISMPLGALAVLILAQRVGSWAVTPPVLWALAAGAVVAALVVGIWHWPRVAVVRARWTWFRIVCFGLSVTVSLVIATVMSMALVAANA